MQRLIDWLLHLRVSQYLPNRSCDWVATRPLTQNSWSLWRQTPESLAFLDEWARANADFDMVIRAPFADQTVVELLAIRRGLKSLWWPVYAGFYAALGPSLALAVRRDSSRSGECREWPRAHASLPTPTSATLPQSTDTPRLAPPYLISRTQPAHPCAPSHASSPIHRRPSPAFRKPGFEKHGGGFSVKSILTEAAVAAAAGFQMLGPSQSTAWTLLDACKFMVPRATQEAAAAGGGGGGGPAESEAEQDARAQ